MLKVFIIILIFSELWSLVLKYNTGDVDLYKEQVTKIYSILINQTGGIDGIRDEGLLESALNAPFINKL